MKCIASIKWSDSFDFCQSFVLLVSLAISDFVFIGWLFDYEKLNKFNAIVLNTYICIYDKHIEYTHYDECLYNKPMNVHAIQMIFNIRCTKKKFEL